MSIILEGLHEALPIIEKFAPTIGSVLGGLPGLAASSALSLLGAAFNTNSGDIPRLAASIISDPNVQDKLQSLEKAHSSWLPFIDNMRKLRKADISINLEWDNTENLK